MWWLRRNRIDRAGRLIRSIPTAAVRASGDIVTASGAGIRAASGATIRRFGPGQAVFPGFFRRRRDPAPSRLMYRLHRLWLTPSWRRLVRVGLPLALVTAVIGLWVANPDNRMAVVTKVEDIRQSIENRDAFMVREMEVAGASDAVEKGVRGMLPVDLPASSFDIDLKDLRVQLQALDAVAAVDLRIKPGGVLSVVVTERVPALLWRHGEVIEMLDADGHRVASVTGRDIRRDLPIIAGRGADQAAGEALALIDAAGPVLPRLRGLERRGERRWDVVLDRGQRIMLPAEDPVGALKQALALARDQDMLGRDVTIVDLRRPGQLTLRMGIDAQNAIRQARGLELLEPQDNENQGGVRETAGNETADRRAG